MSRLTAVPRRIAKKFARNAASMVLPVVGTDMTDEITARSTLVVAPHPDDETLGCGATIARMRSRGTVVFVLLITGGGQSPRPAGMTVADLTSLRRSEAADALAILGVDAEHTIRLDFPDGGLHLVREALVEAIKAVLSRIDVSQVMVTSLRDRHPDHATVAEATVDTVDRYFPAVRLYEYAVWQRLPALTAARDLGLSALGAQPGSQRPVRTRPHLVSTEGFLNVKRQAMSEYQSQLPHFPTGFVDDFFLMFESFTGVRLPCLRPARGGP